MARSPFDLSFDDFIDAGVRASRAAREEAEQAGVPVASMDAALPSTAHATWTADRVELLKTLWLDGLSASQIARAMGGATRNSILKKVQRLGLSGRAVGAKASVYAVPMTLLLEPEAGSMPAVATVFTLGAHMCKWPIGDPALDNYTFCGRRAMEGEPYCEDHAAIAYQPAKGQGKAKESTAVALAKSLRRYI
jgi:GcrA cell cycle regulator